MAERRTCACGRPAVLSGQCGRCFRGGHVYCPGCRHEVTLTKIGLCQPCAAALRAASVRARGHLSERQQHLVAVADLGRLVQFWPTVAHGVLRLREGVA